MTDMNGHEVVNGESHLAADRFRTTPLPEPIVTGMTKQQLVILQHLQKGESITPWKAKYEYRCESLGGVISALRKRGWDIRTYRCKDKAGNKFPSYRLRGTYTKSDQEEPLAPLFDDASQEIDPVPDLLSVVEEPDEMTPPLPTEKTERRGRHAGGATNIDVIKDHLLSGKSISYQEAMDLYGMSGGGLTSVISKLRNEEGLRIDTIKEKGSRQVSYCLSKAVENMDAHQTSANNDLPIEGGMPQDGNVPPAQAQEEPLDAADGEKELRTAKWSRMSLNDANAAGYYPTGIAINLDSPTDAAAAIRDRATSEFITELRDLLAPPVRMGSGETTTASIINIRKGKEGPELLLVCEGETENKPFCKLTQSEAEYIAMNLNLLAHQTRDR